MTRRYSMASFALLALLAGSTASGHELWFLPDPGSDPTLTRLYFGDSPAPGEAERVAEIAHTKVWIDGKAVDVKRLPDGLEVRIPKRRPELISAYADRGVVDHQGDSFIITLAAYAQSRPVARIDDLKLGLDDDQLRLLLVSGGGKTPAVKAIWKGKPAADLAVKLFRGTAESSRASDRRQRRDRLPRPEAWGGVVAGASRGQDARHARREGVFRDPPQGHADARAGAHGGGVRRAAGSPTLPGPGRAVTRPGPAIAVPGETRFPRPAERQLLAGWPRPKLPAPGMTRESNRAGADQCEGTSSPRCSASRRSRWRADSWRP